MKTNRAVLAPCACAFLFAVAWSGEVAVAAADWAHWRGPRHDSTSLESDWSWDWPASGPRRLWKTEVGAGYSCLSIRGNEGYTLGYGGSGQDGYFDTLYCIDIRSGNVLWKKPLPTTPSSKKFESAAHSTPVVEGDAVFAMGNHGEFAAFNAANGELLWKRDLVEEGAQCMSYGFGASPAIYKDMVVVNAGIAMNRKTGEVVWKTPKPLSQGYAAPVAGRIGQEDVFFIAGQKGPSTAGLYCLDAQSGKVLWDCPFSKWPLSNSALARDPVLVGENELFYVCGAALRIGYSAAAATPAERSFVWSTSQVNNPVSYNGCLYGFSAYNGDPPTASDIAASRLQCLDEKTGEMKWTKSNMLGMLSLVSDKLLMITMQGELIVAKAAPDGYLQLAGVMLDAGERNGARDGFWTMPVLLNGRIYLRNISGAASTIWCFDVTKQGLGKQ